mmetsp:Transcript_32807/g.50192  ORF Transcript_32807/g.50192 Transcript_32807/m.50192 type:complete len:199 (+) Transcript_32807:27-623(+)
MAAALPITKLASLLVKTLAKPLAKRIKTDFSRHPLTSRVLISVGQTSHSITSRLTIWSAGYRVRSITPLEADKAKSVGADILGEGIVLTITAWTVVFEYDRSSRKSKEKEAKQIKKAQEEREALQEKLHAIDTRLKALEKVVKSNSDSILNFGVKYSEPKEVAVPIDPIEQDENENKENDHQTKPTDGKRTWRTLWLF